MNRSFNIQLLPFLKNISLKRGAIFGSILISALLAFEVFNFGTTSFALHDVLGDLKFAGIQWSAILAFAFCGIDFAGIARIFTPEQGRDEPAEVWYLFGAWLLAAAFNAMLTWWGVAVAISNHAALGGSLVGQTEAVLKVYYLSPNFHLHIAYFHQVKMNLKKGCESNLNNICPCIIKNATRTNVHPAHITRHKIFG